MQTAVTGIGVVAPNGVGIGEFWANTLDARSGITEIQRFDASAYPLRTAGEVNDFEPSRHLPGRLIPQTDRMTQMALAAADWALTDAAVDTSRADPLTMGVVTANAAGGFEFGQRELENLWARGPEHVSAYQSFAWFYAVNTGQISIRHGLRGPTGVLVAEQAGGLDAIGHARRHARHGVQLVVTGGMESTLCPWGIAAQVPNGRLSDHDDPRRAYVPFDAEARGYVPGEGGAILIVEDAAKAWERGAPRVYGLIAGYRATFDPRPGSPRPYRVEEAIRGALADADLAPGDIDLVFADAAGVPELDRAEAAALAAVFGPCAVPVTAPKTMFGRLNGGGAALDAAMALLAIRDGLAPPTVNVGALAEGCEIDLVRETRRMPVRAALVVARGYGGFNSAMVLTAQPPG
ncbi:ketosynthase chain-length factor [Nucisporomicrobium flavum]|jgi:minimal PKS chain-length factor (CLF/KS beta)|uniref:ketosynthase chain-length factor n=1 Tax=Nucisporomicrobium flavum TaxID=2785915 RepID=UPI0018F5E8C8|nr:ketosynthase chain-length factor [Nucisporomicrobium flavum]